MNRALGVFARHQLGSMTATVVDFGAMTLVVSGVGQSPVLGTVIGASFGAVTNFLLGRRWIFRAHLRPVPGQAARYAVTSATSLGLNALGEWVLTSFLGVQYQLARACVAFLVGLAFNFPMQRYFVFAHGLRERAR